MRTCSTMIFTDGTNSKYAVMRGPMRGKTFNAHAAEIVAVYERRCTDTNSFAARVADIQDYERKITAKHATREAPAVHWQR